MQFTQRKDIHIRVHISIIRVREWVRNRKRNGENASANQFYLVRRNEPDEIFDVLPKLKFIKDVVVVRLKYLNFAETRSPRKNINIVKVKTETVFFFQMEFPFLSRDLIILTFRYFFLYFLEILVKVIFSTVLYLKKKWSIFVFQFCFWPFF